MYFTDTPSLNSMEAMMISKMFVLIRLSRSAHSRYKRSICSGLELSVLLSSG